MGQKHQPSTCCFASKLCCKTWLQTADSLLRRYKIASLAMPELHVISEHVDVQQLPDILLPVVSCRHQLVKSDLDLSCVNIINPPVKVFLSSPNLALIFASSLSTLLVSCSLFWHARMSEIKTYTKHPHIRKKDTACRRALGHHVPAGP